MESEFIHAGPFLKGLILNFSFEISKIYKLKVISPRLMNDKELTLLEYVPLRRYKSVDFEDWNGQTWSEGRDMSKPIVQIGFVRESRIEVLRKLYLDYNSVFQYEEIVNPLNLKGSGFGFKINAVADNGEIAGSINNFDAWKVEERYCDDKIGFGKLRSRERKLPLQMIRRALQKHGEQHFSYIDENLDLKGFVSRRDELEKLRREKSFYKPPADPGLDGYAAEHDHYIRVKIPLLIEIGIAIGLIKDHSLDALVKAVYKANAASR